MAPPAPVTIAVVGRDEAATLPTAVAHARAAARPGDRVVFVDSDSRDDSAAVAARLGVERLPAPAGKGRAMALARDRCETEHLCFLDADLDPACENLIAAVRAALAEDERADLLLGEFRWPITRARGVTVTVYRPLMGALFPELLGAFGRYPFTGFRALRVAAFPGEWPGGFGVETHLNLHAAVSGHRVRTVDAGIFLGAVRPPRPEIGREIGRAVLDAAVRAGRLAASARPAWEAWLDGAVAVLGTQRDPLGDRDGFPARIAAASARPLPAFE